MRLFPILLCSQLLILPLAVAATSDPSCGTYLAKGKLLTEPTGANVLEVNPGTSERFDIVVHGLTLDDMTGYAGKNIRLKIDLYYSSNGILRADVQGHPAATHLEASDENPLTLLAQKRCKESTKPRSG